MKEGEIKLYCTRIRFKTTSYSGGRRGRGRGSRGRGHR
eukprot:UN16285